MPKLSKFSDKTHAACGASAGPPTPRRPSELGVERARGQGPTSVPVRSSSGEKEPLLEVPAEKTWSAVEGDQ